MKPYHISKLRRATARRKGLVQAVSELDPDLAFEVSVSALTLGLVSDLELSEPLESADLETDEGALESVA